MNNSFLYKVDLPFTQKIISFRDITTKEQLDLEKINLYYPQDIDYYLNYFDSFYKIIKECVENQEDITDLNIIELILLCLKIRIISIGNILEFSIKTENEEVKNAKIKIELNDLIKSILESGISSLKNTQIQEQDIVITLGWPSIKSIQFFYNLYFTDMGSSEKIVESLPEYITEINIKDDLIQFSQFSHDQKEKIFDGLPASLKNKLQDAIIENINGLMSSDIFNISYFKDQRFNFYNLFFIEIIKMIFTQNPKRIYEEIYILSNFNIDSNYVMNLSSTERKIYISFIESQQKSQNQQTQPDSLTQPDIKKRTVDDLAVEFGDIPPN